MLAGGWSAARPQRRESLLRNRDFVGRHRQAAFGDVKQTLRGALVALRIVQHALRDAIGLQTRR